jgi:hypothetical protein
MKKDNTQYFNDEWNIKLKDISKKLLEHTGNMKFSELGKYINIDKQIINKDANKHTK